MFFKLKPRMGSGLLRPLSRFQILCSSRSSFALFQSSPRLWSCGTPSCGTHDSSGPSAPHNPADGATGACGPSVDIRAYGSSTAFGSLFWEFIFGSFLLPKTIKNTRNTNELVNTLSDLIFLKMWKSTFPVRWIYSISSNNFFGKFHWTLIYQV